MKDKPRFVIFAHNAGYDKLHSGWDPWTDRGSR